MSGDDGELNAEARVVLNLLKEHRSSFEKFDSRSYSNLEEDMVEERDGQ